MNPITAIDTLACGGGRDGLAGMLLMIVVIMVYVFVSIVTAVFK